MARDGVTVKVVGLDKAIANVKKFQFIKREAIRIAVRDIALDVERTAKEFVPVLTGRLKTSIQTDLTALLSGLTFSAMVGSPVKYAPFVEFGTRKMHAQPYLYPAWLIGQRDLIVRVGKILATPIRTI
ncbi:hypothetical protein LCGC14_2248180 [marine sediment metagenome]|uniref:HK97 gp10 family phage protein n=1 Tax=marine sediment metagenome TaxID=412755 RepID=A0A0F9FYC5_9ZZZZ